MSSVEKSSPKTTATTTTIGDEATTEPEKTISVMYNARFGGFSFSSDAIAEYNVRKPKDVPEMRMSTCVDIDRTDAIMAQICKEMGPKANGMFAKIQIEEVPARFSKHFSISDYDGKETVCISFRKYQLECILRILDTQSMTNNEKIEMINLVFSDGNKPFSSFSGTNNNSNMYNNDNDDDEEYKNENDRERAKFIAKQKFIKAHKNDGNGV